VDRRADRDLGPGSHGGGMVLGTNGAFLVVEEKSHALARGAKPLARLRPWCPVMHGACPVRSRPRCHAWGDARAALGRARRPFRRDGTTATPKSGRFWQPSPVLRGANRAHFGHALEPQFPMNIALAAIAFRRGELFRRSARRGSRRGCTALWRRVVVNKRRHWRGEGLALVEASSADVV